MNLRPLVLVASLLIAVAPFAGVAQAQEAGAPDDAYCQDLAEEMAVAIEDFGAEQQAEADAFYSLQEDAYDTFAEEEHTDDEWDAFYESQAAEAESFGVEQAAESEAFYAALEEEWVNECESYDGSYYDYEDDEYYYEDDNGDLPPACQGYEESLVAALEELSARWEYRFSWFSEQYESERERMIDEGASSEEWQAWDDEWGATALALWDEFLVDFETTMDSYGLGACADALGDDLYEGAFPTLVSEDEWDYENETDWDGDYDPFEDAAFEIWAECEAEIANLDPDSPTYDADADALWLDCAERVNALYDDAAYEQEYEYEDYSEYFGSFQVYWDDAGGQVVIEGIHVVLHGLVEAEILTDFYVEGQYVLEALWVDGYLADFSLDETEEGSTINLYDADGETVLSVVDHPNGWISVWSTSEVDTFSFDLPDWFEVTDEGDTIAFSAPGVEGAILVWDGKAQALPGNLVELEGSGTLVVFNENVDSATIIEDEPEETSAFVDLYMAATLAGHIGGEIWITGSDQNSVKTGVAPMGALEITNIKKGEKSVSLVVDSKKGEGKTLAFKADLLAFGTTSLAVEVVELGSGGSRTSANVRLASSAEDALDPTNDGDAIEFWIVVDKLGVQVLVSFPHFSAKEVTVKAASKTPSDGDGGIVPGFHALVAAAAVGVALVALGLRRRP